MWELEAKVAARTAVVAVMGLGYVGLPRAHPGHAADARLVFDARNATRAVTTGREKIVKL